MPRQPHDESIDSQLDNLQAMIEEEQSRLIGQGFVIGILLMLLVCEVVVMLIAPGSIDERPTAPKVPAARLP